MPGKTALRVAQLLLLVIVTAVIVFGRKNPNLSGPAPASIDAPAPGDLDSPIVLRRQPTTQHQAFTRTMINVPGRNAHSPTPGTSPQRNQGLTAGIPADRRVRRHRIVEGDTIRELARQYLGDPDRYMELVTVNANVLTQPGVLPLGEYLVVPPAAAASPPRRTFSPPMLPPGDTPSYLDQSPRPLLPVK